MDEVESLSQRMDCKYHVVFIPKCRRKTLYTELRRHLGEVFRKLAMQKECRIEEGHLMPDHVHMMISIPPKYAVSQVVGFIKGKSANPPWPASTANVGAISWASISGPEGTTSLLWGGTSKQSVSTSRTRKRRISAWSNSICGADVPP